MDTRKLYDDLYAGAKSVRGASGTLSSNRRTGAPKDPGLIVYGLAHPLQAGEVHIYREEARIAVHRPLIVPGVRDRRHERLCGRATPGAGTAFAGLFGDYGMR